ncbi:Uncharacterised protein [Mycobacteroides abscessus subsp. abscessus]|uniref:hypothetical protein n=1 Tax=Mycobacteroides abscessus TaxID=36809 RepID=UPI000927A033|nr:hypothetical protein [Mycobacteroides abscessus]RIR58243.1 hypothetical protein D2E37_08695 [Mycobacteroides abscessus]RIS86476.1 hypothetical protein D2E53_08695 [Mycobacteroides abscessus]SHT13380.1 Uncharacterised protein [Mycobacteroides abscessus subsp. abscessus]SIA20290.1 Uncharacterised protein [Mycobacteroides abscessus subsp. abscessus]SID50470.1 Uncharacterised protein [Mycobacteroides abscessus subsp. abscessus]
MSTAKDRSIGEELILIIRAEIRAYDERKDEALRLRKVADRAVAEAERAAEAARESKPNSIGGAISAAIVGDLNAQAIDALFERQQKPLANFTTTISAASVADGLGAWQPRGTGENPPRRRWWRKKR